MHTNVLKTNQDMSSDTNKAADLTDFIFTSESVSEGHPDKICDQISDTILDLYLSVDPEARVACEVMALTDFVCIGGEVRSSVEVSNEKIEQAVRETIKDIGYAHDGFHWESAEIDIRLIEQSPDIAQGVDEGTGVDKEEGAGDQGIMFGYACRETEDLMPAPIYYSHAILEELARARKSGELAQLGPDAKSQVTLEYQNDKPVRARSIVVSTQHDDGLSQDDVTNLVKPYIEKILPTGWMPNDEELYVNPTGRFVIGGPVGDAGLTGRKIIVDTYGGAAPHGGGAFSGKDPTKVDRSAAYAARYLAKNVVAAGLADACTIQLSYAIGVSKPISVYLNTHQTGYVSENAIVEKLRELVNLSPRGIREHLELNKPIYKRTAAYGHFGHKPDADGGFSWERTDLVDDLKTLL